MNSQTDTAPHLPFEVVEAQEQGADPFIPVAQAFQAGGELVRQTHEIAEVKAIVSRHEAALHELSAALGTFRDKVMIPIREELSFLRYNLGDKANVTVSQMQGILQHFHRLYDGILTQSGLSNAQIAAVREQLGIPSVIPSLEQLAAEGRPEVDAAAMLASLQDLARQNARLLADASRREARHQSEMQALMERVNKLEGGVVP